jgi:Fe-S oxidoreductase
MLPLGDRISFFVFAMIATATASVGLLRVFNRIRRGRDDAEQRWNRPFRRLGYALQTTLTQSRTFRMRPVVSIFHALIFYGFAFYLLVNVIDSLEGYLPFAITSQSILGATYNLCADVLSFLVMIGVLALILRRFFLPSQRDFRFNPRTLRHPKIRASAISRDSLIVSSFILIHVGSRALGSAALARMHGEDHFEPFASMAARLIPAQHAEFLHILAYWGALGSILAFLSYFPFSKHLHIFTSPINYFFARQSNSGEIPLAAVDLKDETQVLGVGTMEDFSWPRVLDSYACIQCNRCQDVCPASATGKALSPAALEINKRMELNRAAGKEALQIEGSRAGLLELVISPEALWACTTCGACMQVCPTQNEQMLDIVDIRRNQVMIAGEFPPQLQSAFRGMERSKNPWGINQERRMDWAQGLSVSTIDEKPEPDILYWVGCAASYDPQAQKTARAFVQLMQMAQVDFAVLGKKECCTGDSARRAGNEYLYQELATSNISTLNAIKLKTIVATCPHCFNSLGNEYGQLGGNYNVVHHTELLDTLVASGRLPKPIASSTITYHDPCYLGRHNGVYDAPRNLLRVLGQDFVEMERNRENSFCCGAGGAQFWKEEEPGDERISSNRYREAQRTLGSPAGVLAVGCPFCKSMFDSTPSEESEPLIVRDIAELMLESLLAQESMGDQAETSSGAKALPVMGAPETSASRTTQCTLPESLSIAPENVASIEDLRSNLVVPARKKWQPLNTRVSESPVSESSRQCSPDVEGERNGTPSTPRAVDDLNDLPQVTVRKKWTPNTQ